MLHINKFIDRIKAAESRSQRDLIMTINEARDLHGDITKLLLSLQVLREQSTATPVEPIANIEVAGGSF
jgi:hypothetical protein